MNATLTAAMLNRIKPDLKTIVAFLGDCSALNRPISCIGSFRRKNKINLHLQQNIDFLEAYAIDLEATSFLGVTHNPF